MTSQTEPRWGVLLLVVCVIGFWWSDGFVSSAAPRPAAACSAPCVTVTSSADAGDGTLRSAIASAVAGTTIIFAAALSDTTISLITPLEITSDITIDGGASTSGVVIDGQNSTRLFRVYDGASLTLRSLLLSHGSSATAVQDRGGAVYNSGTLIVRDVTFRENYGGTGGAIYSNGALTVVNSTFTGNSAHPDLSAAAIAAWNGSTYTLAHITVADNIAVQSSIVLVGTGMLANSIIVNTRNAAGERTQDCLVGSGLTITSTLIEDGTCGAPITGSAGLGTFGAHGGKTPDYGLLADSAARGAGTSSICTGDLVGGVDQRGQLRAACDLGAVAYSAALPSTSTPTIPTASATSSEPTATPFIRSTNTPTRIMTQTRTRTVVRGTATRTRTRATPTRTRTRAIPTRTRTRPKPSMTRTSTRSIATMTRVSVYDQYRSP